MKRKARKQGQTLRTAWWVFFYVHPRYGRPGKPARVTWYPPGMRARAAWLVVVLVAVAASTGLQAARLLDEVMLWEHCKANGYDDWYIGRWPWCIDAETGRHVPAHIDGRWQWLKSKAGKMLRVDAEGSLGRVTKPKSSTEGSAPTRAPSLPRVEPLPWSYASRPCASMAWRPFGKTGQGDGSRSTSAAWPRLG